MKSLMIILILVISFQLFAQNIFTEQIIVDSLYWATSVSAYDIDNDNDLDILATAYEDVRGIVWYENLDGKGEFSQSKTIVRAVGRNALCFMEAFAIDIDGDGDLDIVSANEVGSNLIAWFENLDGKGHFSDLKSIVGQIPVGGADDLYIADLDSDDDIDILPALGQYNKLVWYENSNGLGDFMDENIISENVDCLVDVFAADIDNDGDTDVISVSMFDNKVAWYENLDGKGSFGPQNVITNLANRARSVYAADIDNDNDIDVLSASSEDKKIAWYENTDGKGTFGEQKIITISADGALSVFAADLDLDGDIDVLSASIVDNKICWYENFDGKGNFGEQIVINADALIATSVFAADLDGDEDIDILSSSEGDHKIIWYKNNTNVTSLEAGNKIIDHFQLYQNYPNPFNPSTTIHFTLKKSNQISLKIFNLAGQEVATLSNEIRSAGEHQVQWQAEGLPSGIYLARLQAGKHSKTMKLVLQK